MGVPPATSLTGRPKLICNSVSVYLGQDAFLARFESLRCRGVEFHFCRIGASIYQLVILGTQPCLQDSGQKSLKRLRYRLSIGLDHNWRVEIAGEQGLPEVIHPEITAIDN